ncbi:MAG: response regulator [Actinomycetota bacterium]
MRLPRVEPCRVLIVDDHKLLGEVLTERLEAESEVCVVGCLADPFRLAQTLDSTKPDLVLMDVDLGSADGIDLTRQIVRNEGETKVLIVTCLQDPSRVVEAIQAGAIGWVIKDGPIDDLMRAIRSAMAGETYLPSSMLRQIIVGVVKRRTEEQAFATRLSALTEKEREVLQLMVDGMDRAAISKKLFLSPNTVRTHIKNMFAKLEVHSSLEAVGLGLRAGLRPG